MSRFSIIPTKLLNCFFLLLYHEFAWAYDAVACLVSLGRWNRWTSSVLTHIESLPVLEIGYGPGHLQVLMNKNGIKPFGIDESWFMARQARHHWLKNFPGDEHQIARGLAQFLPYPAAHFGTVFSTFPSPYIFNPSTLSEICRILKPQGKLVVLLSATLTGKGFLEQAVAYLFRISGEDIEARTPAATLLEPFHQAGFKVDIKINLVASSRLFYIIATRRD